MNASHKRIVTICISILVAALFHTVQAAEKKIVLLAGSASHGSGEHEFNAGCQLLRKCLNQVPGVRADVFTNGWPQDEKVLADADAIFLYSDGGGGHPFNRPERREVLAGLMSKGVGLGCAHYAVEVPKGPTGDALLQWIGGYFEMHWSVNPHWTADFKQLPEHPITRGVKPFKVNDEWYYHMRFPEGMKGVTPILTDLPPKATLDRQDGPHSGNPAVREAISKGEPQHVMWATERPDGGRGFGFTGGHFHRNWVDENFRKIVLNAILWTARIEVPEAGVQSSITADDLKQGLDKKK
jgi:type 1 glutamine amidotransferase